MTPAEARAKTDAGQWGLSCAPVRHLLVDISPLRDSVAAAAEIASEAVAILPIPIDVDRFTPQPDEAWLARLDTPRDHSLGIRRPFRAPIAIPFFAIRTKLNLGAVLALEKNVLVLDRHRPFSIGRTV